MATLNLGRIKPVFRGAYAGGTAYVVDDIVTSGNETFICIQASTGNATSNASYWTKLAAKGSDGTNGTDVGTTITTQGDILYRDGSGLQRLAKPASDKFLQNTSGGVLSWADAGGGKVLQVVTNSATSNFVTTSDSFTYVSGMPSVSITPSATSSKVLVMFNGGATELNGGNGYVTIYRDSTNLGTSAGFWQMQHQANYRRSGSQGIFLDTPNTTSATTYQIRIRNSSSGSNTGFGESCTTSIICMEIGA